MAIGGPFRELGGFLDACEQGACEVRRVQVQDAGDGSGTASMAADVELVLDPEESAGNEAPSLCSPRIGADGTVRFALESTRELVPVAEYDVTVELLSATVEANEGARVSICVEPTTDDRDAVARAPLSAVERDSADVETDRSNGRAPTANGTTRNGTTEGPVDENRRDADRDLGRDRDRELPPFKDPDLLAEVYDSCDTFAEMADAIDMDVTAETVRRYMIDFDIHQPNSYRTGQNADSEPADSVASGVDGAVDGQSENPEGETAGGNRASARPTSESDSLPGPASGAADSGDADPVVLSDGLGLPDDVTAETLIETVKRSNTIYEVTQDIDLDRQDAFEMLHDLNLVDLVMGRLATEAEREITREEIVDRLRAASATQ